MTKALVRLAWLLALAWPCTGAAQYDWESGGGQPPPDGTAQTTTSSGTTSASSSSSSSSSASAPSTAPQGDDHARVVGHVAVGYLGVNSLQDGTLAAADAIAAPAIGVRYWIMDLVGIDVGLGIGYATSSASAGGTSRSNGDDFGMLIHAGVPLAPAHTDHFVFEITPEANVGFATGSRPNPGGADTSRSGVLFQIGGRVGCELHFGFIGVPQLSLTASVGLYFQYITASQSQAGASVSQDATTLTTTVSGTPWQIFANTLNAFYYF